MLAQALGGAEQVIVPHQGGSGGEVVDHGQVLALGLVEVVGEGDLHPLVGLGGHHPRLAALLAGLDVEDGGQGLQEQVQ